MHQALSLFTSVDNPSLISVSAFSSRGTMSMSVAFALFRAKTGEDKRGHIIILRGGNRQKWQFLKYCAVMQSVQP